MSKDVAVLENNFVIAINVHPDNYQIQDNEKVVTNPAYVGGDYFDNYFYPPKPYASWTRDGLGNWESPIPYPTDGLMYQWDEEKTDWVAVVWESETPQIAE